MVQIIDYAKKIHSPMQNANVRTKASFLHSHFAGGKYAFLAKREFLTNLPTIPPKIPQWSPTRITTPPLGFRALSRNCGINVGVGRGRAGVGVCGQGIGKGSSGSSSSSSSSRRPYPYRLSLSPLIDIGGWHGCGKGMVIGMGFGVGAGKE